MAMRETFLRVFNKLAHVWSCNLKYSEDYRNFYFDSEIMPTNCSILSDWYKGDLLHMKWERLLGIVTPEVDLKYLLADNYQNAPPFFAITYIKDKPYLCLVDTYSLSWEFTDEVVEQILSARYGQGLVVGMEIPGLIPIGVNQNSKFEKAKQFFKAGMSLADSGKKDEAVPHLTEALRFLDSNIEKQREMAVWCNARLATILNDLATHRGDYTLMIEAATYARKALSLGLQEKMWQEAMEKVIKHSEKFLKKR